MVTAEALAWLAAGAALPLAALGVVLVRNRLRRPEARRRRAAEAALLDGEEVPRLVMRRDGTVLAANAPARRRWAAETPLAELSRRLPAEDEEAAEAFSRLRAAVEAGGNEVLDVPLAANGAAGVEWLRVAVSPAVAALPGGHGGLPADAVLWRAEDVTARRAIDDVLRRDRDHLSDFLYFLPVGVYSADIDGRLRSVNQRFAEWLGWTPSELTGAALADLLHEGGGPEWDGTWRGVVAFRARDGRPLPAFVAQDLYDDGGETRTRTAVLRLDDVAPPSLSGPGGMGEHGEASFRRLFERAPTALVVLDETGCVEAVNGAFARLVGQPRGDLTDRPLADLLLEDDREALEALLARLALGSAGGGASAALDVRLGDDAARARVCSLAVAALGGEGEGVTGFLVHAVDATEQKSLEMQFAQAQKMQAMGQLAGGVAHDFNNLLTAMIGFCDLLLQRHGAGDPSFADIMQIKQNANRAANLVRQLLAFSRRQPLMPKLLNATDALSELSHLLRRLLGEHVTLSIVHGRDLGLVRVDPGQFDQVIINLAVNARDAMPGGGALTIRTGVVHITEARKKGAEDIPPGRYVEIVVSDTGTGIPQDYIGRIFEPFFSTKVGVTGAGTGLGLSTVYGIVRQTDGYIFVDSEPGAGATFTIWLPRHDPETGQNEAPITPAGPADAAEATLEAAEEDGFVPPPDFDSLEDIDDADLPVPTAPPPPVPVEEAVPPAPEEGPAALGGSGRILLVEDEDAVRVFAIRALRNKGYTVLEARTGEGALDILRDEPDIDLLITDMVMPGMDGATLARLVRVERPEIKVILISGYSEEVARGDLVDSRDVHFLPKPFNLAQLAGRVREVLNG
ncbi:ATP-binding protein [Caenispirillum salinarum]|uniref:hybrid sensor histidine kinase/response regulator n=1 Tax=Caenispirillum salinarum TaxID=859058 RepID=UPI00384CE8FE